MKLTSLLLSLLLFASSGSYAQGHPHRGGEEAFELITSYVDEATLAELTAARDAVQATRDELKALREAGATEEEINAVREELKAQRMALGDQIRSIVEANDELKAELRALSRENRRERIANGFALRNDEVFAQIVDASGDQADTLLANQDAIDALRADIRAQRDAGATREDLSDLTGQLRDLVGQQRDIVRDVLESNDELRDAVIADAREARRHIRDRIRDRRIRRRDAAGQDG